MFFVVKSTKRIKVYFKSRYFGKDINCFLEDQNLGMNSCRNCAQRLFLLFLFKRNPVEKSVLVYRFTYLLLYYLFSRTVELFPE